MPRLRRCRSCVLNRRNTDIADTAVQASAPLVAIETIVPTAVWKAFPPSEQARWHYHRIEIPKVSATMPDVSAAEAKKVVASLMETYGKVYIFWNPAVSKYPVGQPAVYRLP